MYMLFGYKIDALGTNQYRLRNQYSFDSEDLLLFQVRIHCHLDLLLYKFFFNFLIYFNRFLIAEMEPWKCWKRHFLKR